MSRPIDLEKEKRVQKIKENLREKHALEIESRLQNENREEELDQDPILSRFSKYRRSGSQKHVSNLIKKVEGSFSISKDQEDEPPLEFIHTHHNHNASSHREPNRDHENRVYFFENDGESSERISSKPSSKVSVTLPYSSKPSTTKNYLPKDSISREREVEDPYYGYDEPELEEDSSISTNRKVIKKPVIPLILRSPSSSEPNDTPNSKLDTQVQVSEESSSFINKRKKPSILKRKVAESSGSSGSVSFDLDHDHLELESCSGPGTTSSTGGLIRTKSSDSNLSCDSETGYWSGADSCSTSSHHTHGGILKHKRPDSCTSDDQDFKSILKPRRSSLGNSVGNITAAHPSSSDSPSSEQLHSILKRKLSYDSSVILRDVNNSHKSNSLSTHSLPGSIAISSTSLSPEPKPILKKKSSTEELDDMYESSAPSSNMPTVTIDLTNTNTNPKPILKKREGSAGGAYTSGDEGIICNSSSGTNVSVTGETKPKPILKKKSGFGDRRGQSILKHHHGIGGSYRDLDSHSHDDEDYDEEFGGHGHGHGYGATSRYYSSCSEVNDISSSSFTSSSTSRAFDPYTKRRVSEPSPNSPKFFDEEDQDGSAESTTSRFLKFCDSKMNDRTESEEDIINTLSVAERRSLFIQMEREKLGLSVNSADTRKKPSSSLRFRTQPITSHEIELALATEELKKVPSEKLKSDILTADGKKEFLGELLGELSERNEHKHEKLIESALSGIMKRKINRQDRPATPPQSPVSNNKPIPIIIAHKPPVVPTILRKVSGTIMKENDHNEIGVSKFKTMEPEEPSKLSLKDRVNLFNHFAESSAAYRLSSRRPVTSKRFSTQPVTNLELNQSYAERRPKSNSPTERTQQKQEIEKEKEEELECDRDEQPSVAPEDTKSKPAPTKLPLLSKKNRDKMRIKTSRPQHLVQHPTSASSNDDELSDPDDGIDSSSGSGGSDGPETYSSGPEYSDSSDKRKPKGKASDSEFGFVKKHLSKSSSCNFGSSGGKKSSSVIESAAMEEPLAVLHPNKIPRNSIADKIAALKSNGESNWKKKIATKEAPSLKATIVFPVPLPNSSSGEEDQNDKEQLRQGNNKELSSSVVASRKNLLEKSQDGWRSRVGRNDAKDLTVNEKLSKAGKLPKIEPGKLKGIKAVLPPIKFRPKNELTGAPLTGTNNRHTVCITETETTDSICPVAKVERLNLENRFFKRSLSSPKNRSENSSCSSDDHDDSTKVTKTIVPNDNETFTSFFAIATQPSKLTITSKISPIDESSFKSITTSSHQLLGLRKNVRGPTHRNVPGPRNPIKSLASRLSTQEQTYSETKPEILEKEIKKRSQIENLSKTSHLSVEALAGLISKEDFTKISLKKAESCSRPREHPYPMLIRIKGKRFVQIRLVRPTVESISSGDCYVLVTADKVYQYIGEFSNRMEKSKLSDVVLHIVQKKDLGTRLGSISEVVTLEEPISDDSHHYQNFLKILGADSRRSDDQLGDEIDEAYELGVIRTNRAFEVNTETEELVPILEEGGGWGCQPKYSILKDDRVLVFDFGSEMYFWSGSRADPNSKKIGYQLARQMFEDSYDNFNTQVELQHEWSPLGHLVVGDKRPNWAWLKKINQHMEPILFIEKFHDWPDESGKLIKVQQQQKRGSDAIIKVGGFNFQSCDVSDLLKSWVDVPDPSLELEGFDIGRGKEVHDEKEFRHYLINSVGVKAWRISEFSKMEVDRSSLGHFWSNETYVIRWQYNVTQISRDLKGNKSKFGGTALGRDRTVYFFWHGKDSKLTEQGASALMTVELDQEKEPQVRVVQGKEPPAFLRLFHEDQGMWIHSGSPEEDSSNSELKLFIAMGCVEDEGHMVQVPMEPSSFRSRGSFLILDSTQRNVCIWNGSHTPQVSKNIAQSAAKKLIISKPPELFSFGGLPYTLSELEEGDEPSQFFSRLTIDPRNEMRWRESYSSLKATNPNSIESQITFSTFRFTTLNGHLEGIPIPCPHRKAGIYNPFPILQETLYQAQQPSIFLIQSDNITWLWMGWKPRGDDENENTATGSGDYRWNSERKAAIETGLKFLGAAESYGYIVYAGLEPPLFQSLFPYWTVHEDSRIINLEDGGKILNSLTPFHEAHAKFLKSTYTLQELQEKPEGVDLLKLETYLSDDEFENILKMPRDEFNKLQQWKKAELKKQAGLF